MLAVAVGMAFPGSPNAEAQGNRSGYTYTRLICQEHGQHPRWYYVRDPMPGSDWRNDGGWAIIQERGSSSTRAIHTFIRGSAPVRSVTQWNNANYRAGARFVDNSAGTQSKEKIASEPLPPLFAQTDLNNYEQGEYDGYNGVTVSGSSLRLVALDANGDGAIDPANDAVYGPGNDSYYLLFHFTMEILQYGGSYIRWANLAWCR